MAVLKLHGDLSIGPPCACPCDDSLEASSSIHLELTPCNKSSQVDTGFQKRQLNSPSAFVPCSGIGIGDTVQQADFLEVRTQSPCLLRITFFNPNLPLDPFVSVVPIQGLLLIEPPGSYYVALLEVQGVGFLQYLASGQV